MRRHLQQSADDSNSYVKVQLAFITTGAAAASLQQQLLSSLPGGLISGLQQAGLTASSVVFSSLDVQQVSRRLALIQFLVNRAMHLTLVQCHVHVLRKYNLRRCACGSGNVPSCTLVIANTSSDKACPA